MKSQTKLQEINKNIEIINLIILKDRSDKFVYLNNGSNNYCIMYKNSTLKFNTYSDVLSALELVIKLCMK